MATRFSARSGSNEFNIFGTGAAAAPAPQVQQPATARSYKDATAAPTRFGGVARPNTSSFNPMTGLNNDGTNESIFVSNGQKFGQGRSTPNASRKSVDKTFNLFDAGSNLTATQLQRQLALETATKQRAHAAPMDTTRVLSPHKQEVITPNRARAQSALGLNTSNSQSMSSLLAQAAQANGHSNGSPPAAGRGPEDPSTSIMGKGGIRASGAAKVTHDTNRTINPAAAASHGTPQPKKTAMAGKANKESQPGVEYKQWRASVPNKPPTEPANVVPQGAFVDPRKLAAERNTTSKLGHGKGRKRFEQKRGEEQTFSKGGVKTFKPPVSEEYQPSGGRKKLQGQPEKREAPQSARGLKKNESMDMLKSSVTFSGGEPDAVRGRARAATASAPRPGPGSSGSTGSQTARPAWQN